jgi:hypothetical protein
MYNTLSVCAHTRWCSQKAYEHLREYHIDALLTECAYPAVAAALQRGGCGSSSSNKYNIEPDAYEAAVAGEPLLQLLLLLISRHYTAQLLVACPWSHRYTYSS